MSTDELLFRRATTADWPAISRLFFDSVHNTADPEASDLDGQLFDPTRSMVALDGDDVVGHTGSFGRLLRAPGADVSAAHVAMVAVAPAHRRRGLLTRLLTGQLNDARDAGEPVAVLWASEGRIYSRFGFGLAATRLAVNVDTREVTRPSPAEPGQIRDAQPTDVAATLRAIYDRVRPTRPGWSNRDDAWWRHRTLTDPAARRRTATGWRAAVHRAPDGTDDGYALWRVHGRWDPAGPNGRVDVREVVAGSGAAYRALWRFLLGIDLTRSLTYPLAAPDEPLIHLVGEPRRLSAVLADALWLRITDLPAALSARRYAAPIDVVLDVTDPLLPANEGRWRLTGDPSGAHCAPTTDAAHLACDASALGASLLGESVLAPLADAGRVRELRRGALAATQLAFGWHRRPSTIEMF